MEATQRRENTIEDGRRVGVISEKIFTIRRVVASRSFFKEIEYKQKQYLWGYKFEHILELQIPLFQIVRKEWCHPKVVR